MMILFYLLFHYSLKRRKCHNEKHNFMERLLGVAHLLVEVKLLINIIVALTLFLTLYIKISVFMLW